MDAAKSLGMTNLQAMRRVILPQALRVVVPPTGNEFIAMLKNTSVAFAIGVVELMNAAKITGCAELQGDGAVHGGGLLVSGVVYRLQPPPGGARARLAARERERPETLFSRALTLMGGSRRV